MGTVTLILGGARSGKSFRAQQMAEQSGKSVTFVATAQALDDEMNTRIQRHRAERPVHWETLEVPLGLASHLKRIQSEVVILDCITLLVTNLLMQFVKDELVDEVPFMQAVQTEIDEWLSALRTKDQHWLVISNEVGLGLVPPYQMGRVYRDGLGWANQRLAREAEKVLFMVAGIPMVVKG